jgi:hypothetical protein
VGELLAGGGLKVPTNATAQPTLTLALIDLAPLRLTMSLPLEEAVPLSLNFPDAQAVQ